MENTDVLLIGYEEWENLGLRSIAAFLTSKGVKVKILPCDKTPKENILSVIHSEKPKIVGFSLIFQRMLNEFADLIAYLRKNGTTAHITIGGHFPTVEFKETLESIPGLDSVVRGEGEETMLELLSCLKKSISLDNVKGLAYRKDGEIKATPPRPLIQNLDDLPYPIRSEHIVNHRGLGICSILASRGCYYDCSFCSIQRFYSESPGTKRRSRSPLNVVREMEHLFHEYNARVFIFEDDDFAMRTRTNQQWVESFIQELKKIGLSDKILWRISCRVDDINAELLKKMMEVGLASIYIGIESGNNQGLKIYNKHYTTDEIYAALDVLRNLELPFEFGFMILNPYSTLATVKEDIAFLKKIGSDGQAICHFTKMLPYAGTPIADILKKEGRLKGTWASPDYNYIDSKLDLLQMFFTQAFHFRNFDNQGLVERLRYAKLDSIVLNKFFANKYNTKFYIEVLKELIRKSNEVCLENMSLAVNFMEKKSEEEILNNWQFLDALVREEKNMESYITNVLDWLLICYS